MVSQFTVPPDAREPSRPSGDAMTWLSEAILKTWRRAVDRLGSGFVHRLSEEGGANALYFRARASARAGDLEKAAQQFADLAEMAPILTAALEGHGEAADRLGQSELARAKYDVARKLRSAVRRGAPDRPFVLRNRGPFPAEIAASTSVLLSGTERGLSSPPRRPVPGRHRRLYVGPAVGEGTGAALRRARQRPARRGSRQTSTSRLQLRAQSATGQ